MSRQVPYKVTTPAVGGQTGSRQVIDQSGVRKAEIEAAEKRQRTRFEMIEYELLSHRMVEALIEIDPGFRNVTANYERARRSLADDTAEQWRADHALLVAREIERYGRERDVARRGGWGADRAELIEYYIALWEQHIVPEGRAENSHKKLHDLWLAAPDGQGVMSENAWQEKHQARLDREFAAEEVTGSSKLFEDWPAEAERERRRHIGSQHQMSA